MTPSFSDDDDDDEEEGGDESNDGDTANVGGSDGLVRISRYCREKKVTTPSSSSLTQDHRSSTGALADNNCTKIGP